MSITLEIYDVFSYAIPGVLYLFTFNEGLKLLRLPFVDISQSNNGYHFFLLALLSYLVGHLFDYISHGIWYRRFTVENPQIADPKQQKTTNLRAGWKRRAKMSIALGVPQCNGQL
jgi:hypothetical protein